MRPVQPGKDQEDVPRRTPCGSRAPSSKSCLEAGAARGAPAAFSSGGPSKSSSWGGWPIPGGEELAGPSVGRRCRPGDGMDGRHRRLHLLVDVLDDCAGSELFLVRHILRLAQLGIVFEDARTLACATDGDVLQAAVAKELSHPRVG